jgi:poly(3-hydroxybutyrate) depolymerase
MTAMPQYVRRRMILPALCACSFWAFGLQAQDAGLALSTSVSYNTQRLSLKLTAEQAKEAERLGSEASEATRAARYADALRFYAQGAAVMHGVEWTPDVELASALRGSLDHAMISAAAPPETSKSAVTVSLTPLYSSDRAALAKLSATAVLLRGNQEIANLAPKTAIDPAKSPFTEKFVIPAEPDGNYVIQIRLTEADGTAPAALRNVFLKDLPIHIEALAAEAQRLRANLAKAGSSGNPALPTAQYALALYERADRGEVNPRAYDFKTEFAAAETVLDAIAAGRDPFAGKHGDFHKAYLSKVDGTLQPYRLFIPDSYDGSKPTAMVVALHGMGGDENSMFDSYGKELTVDAQAHGFIVAAPKGREPASMYRGSAEQDVLDVMAEVERDYKVDRSRVYLMGHSMGGFGTWSIAMNHPDLFAALGPISGGGNAAGMVKIKAIPQYVTHGDDDRTVNVNSSRTMVEAGKKAGAPITYNEVHGGSHVSVAQPAFAPMFDFFAKQARTGPQ